MICYYHVLHLVFHLSVVTLANSNNNLDFQLDEFFPSEPLWSPGVVAEPNTAALIVEKQAEKTNDNRWELISPTAHPSNTGDTAEEVSLVQSADLCPYDSNKETPYKFRLKRGGGSSCSPFLSFPDQRSQAPVRDSNQIYTGGRTPKPRLDSGQNSRITGKPSRQWKKAPVLRELYKDIDLCGIAHPWPICATMEVRRIDDGLTIPLDDSSGRWEHEYCRPLPSFVLGCDPGLGENMWCCHWAFKFKGGADAHPDLRLLYPNICIACFKMDGN